MAERESTLPEAGGSGRTNRRAAAKVSNEKKRCRCCFQLVPESSLLDHPIGLQIGLPPKCMCLPCVRIYNASGQWEWEKDDAGKDKFCRICGEGNLGTVSCDKKECTLSFCEGCIIANCGKTNYDKILILAENNNWHCFVCALKNVSTPASSNPISYTYPVQLPLSNPNRIRTFLHLTARAAAGGFTKRTIFNCYQLKRRVPGFTYFNREHLKSIDTATLGGSAPFNGTTLRPIDRDHDASTTPPHSPLKRRTSQQQPETIHLSESALLAPPFDTDPLFDEPSYILEEIDEDEDLPRPFIIRKPEGVKEVFDGDEFRNKGNRPKPVAASDATQNMNENDSAGERGDATMETDEAHEERKSSTASPTRPLVATAADLPIKMKKVISFSFFLHELHLASHHTPYVYGLMENIHRVHKEWPGWTVRIYYDDSFKVDAPHEILGGGYTQEGVMCNLAYQERLRDTWFGQLRPMLQRLEKKGLVELRRFNWPVFQDKDNIHHGCIGTFARFLALIDLGLPGGVEQVVLADLDNHLTLKAKTIIEGFTEAHQRFHDPRYPVNVWAGGFSARVPIGVDVRTWKNPYADLESKVFEWAVNHCREPLKINSRAEMFRADPAGLTQQALDPVKQRKWKRRREVEEMERRKDSSSQQQEEEKQLSQPRAPERNQPSRASKQINLSQGSLMEVEEKSTPPSASISASSPNKAVRNPSPTFSVTRASSHEDADHPEQKEARRSPTEGVISAEKHVDIALTPASPAIVQSQPTPASGSSLSLAVSSASASTPLSFRKSGRGHVSSMLHERERLQKLDFDKSVVSEHKTEEKQHQPIVIPDAEDDECVEISPPPRKAIAQPKQSASSNETSSRRSNSRAGNSRELTIDCSKPSKGRRKHPSVTELNNSDESPDDDSPLPEGQDVLEFFPYGVDQAFLTDHVWPVLQHDCCTTVSLLPTGQLAKEQKVWPPILTSEQEEMVRTGRTYWSIFDWMPNDKRPQPAHIESFVKKFIVQHWRRMLLDLKITTPYFPQHLEQLRYVARSEFQSKLATGKLNVPIPINPVPSMTSILLQRAKERDALLRNSRLQTLTRRSDSIAALQEESQENVKSTASALAKQIVKEETTTETPHNGTPTKVLPPRNAKRKLDLVEQPEAVEPVENLRSTRERRKSLIYEPEPKKKVPSIPPKVTVEVKREDSNKRAKREESRTKLESDIPHSSRKSSSTTVTNQATSQQQLNVVDLKHYQEQCEWGCYRIHDARQCQATNLPHMFNEAPCKNHHELLEQGGSILKTALRFQLASATTIASITENQSTDVAGAAAIVDDSTPVAMEVDDMATGATDAAEPTASIETQEATMDESNENMDNTPINSRPTRERKTPRALIGTVTENRAGYGNTVVGPASSSQGGVNGAKVWCECSCNFCVPTQLNLSALPNPLYHPFASEIPWPWDSDTVSSWLLNASEAFMPLAIYLGEIKINASFGKLKNMEQVLNLHPSTLLKLLDNACKIYGSASAPLMLVAFSLHQKLQQLRREVLEFAGLQEEQ